MARPAGRTNVVSDFYDRVALIHLFRTVPAEHPTKAPVPVPIRPCRSSPHHVPTTPHRRSRNPCTRA